MLKPLKGRIFDYIKSKPRTWKDISTKFGGSGSVFIIINQLQYDGLIHKPERGIYEIVPAALKSPKR